VGTVSNYPSCFICTLNTIFYYKNSFLFVVVNYTICSFPSI